MVRFHPLHKVSQYFITEDIVVLHVKRREIVTLKQEQRPTVLGMTPGLCMRADLMAWKTSTFCLQTFQLRVDDQECPTPNYPITEWEGELTYKVRQVMFVIAILATCT